MFHGAEFSSSFLRRAKLLSSSSVVDCRVEFVYLRNNRFPLLGVIRETSPLLCDFPDIGFHGVTPRRFRGYPTERTGDLLYEASKHTGNTYTHTSTHTQERTKVHLHSHTVTCVLGREYGGYPTMIDHVLVLAPLPTYAACR